MLESSSSPQVLSLLPSGSSEGQSVFQLLVALYCLPTMLPAEVQGRYSSPPHLIAQKRETQEVKAWKSRVSKSYLSTCVLAAWFTITKGWNQPNWQSGDERLNNTWSTHKLEYSSAVQQERNSDTFCSRDGPWRHYAEWNKPITKGQMLYGSMCMRGLE